MKDFSGDNRLLVRDLLKIYAFETSKVPGYLKVGDTFRPIETRLDEWRKHFKDLIRLYPDKANEEESIPLIDNTIYFRDYSVHKYLESIYPNSRLKKTDSIFKVNPNLYYSNEFFKGVTVNDVKKAIEEIKKDYKNPFRTYDFYDALQRTPDEYHWCNDQKWKLRDNQKKVVNTFLEKVKTQDELLMYAVMRFGKSFTSLSCGLAKNYSKILVVSAKADVINEWKQTVEKPECFIDYRFLVDKDFVNDPNIISKTINGSITTGPFKDKRRVVVFLTLQNLCGKARDGKNIKTKLKEIYNTDFDMIIIDETHYGAWAETYGKPIKDSDEDVEFVNGEIKEAKSLKAQTEKLKKPKVKLHLSGTPYNLLYEEKFNETNIISTIKFSDILDEKEKWNNDHREDINEGKINPETGFEYEWFDNPYFGFPNMARFGFNIPKATKDLLMKSNVDGIFNINELFKTNQKTKTKFIYENNVLDILHKIDGTKSSNEIFPFLDYPTIRDNKICKHIIMVLPFKYSCDAMEILLNKNKSTFKNLINDKVEVLNITGHNLKKSLDSVEKVKKKISECENNNIKTITLTVNKMLTGVTVPEWDTMIMFKKTKSAQDYDQAIYRIQNQFVDVVESKTTKRITKIDKKPQTILVDFDPERMLQLQGLSTRITNKVAKTGIKLDDALDKELKYFPVIVYNAKKLVSLEPQDIVPLINKYNKEKSLLEQANNVELDDSMLLDENIFDYINKQSDKGVQTTLSISNEGETYSDFDAIALATKDWIKHNECDNSSTSSTSESDLDKKTLRIIREKYKACIARMLFYAFLTKSKLFSLNDLINSVEKNSPYLDENKRIFSHLNLDLNFLKLHEKKCKNLFSLDIDSKISNSNSLSKDDTLTQDQKVEIALNRFSRISDSEVITPIAMCDKMVKKIGTAKFKNIIDKNEKILDIASKTGEFTVAIYNYLKNNVDINLLKNSLYSICTSTLTYEFTRKIYEILELPIDHIAKFSSYDLLEIKKTQKLLDYDRINLILTSNKSFDKIRLTDKLKGAKQVMKFGAIVGNPPYHAKKGGTKNFDIWQNFLFASCSMADIVSMIHPARWLVPKAQMEKIHKQIVSSGLREFNYYPDGSKIFKTATVDGGITITLFEKNYKGKIGYYFEGKYKDDYDDKKIFLSNQYEEEIFKILNPKNFGPKTIADRMMGNIGSLAGGEFGYKKDKDISKLKDTSDGMKNPIKIWANKNYNKGSRLSWNYIDKDDLTNIPEKLLKTKKVMIDKKGHAINSKTANIINNIPQIVEENAIASGDVLFIFPEKNVDYHLQLIKSMFMTKTIRFLMTIKQKDLYTRGFDLIPDYIYFIKNLKGKLFTDEFFYKKFKFSNELISYIELKISEKK